MSFLRICSVAVVLMAPAVSQGAGEIVVKVFRRDDPPLCECDPLSQTNPCPVVSYHNAGDPIVIPVAYCTQQINIYANPTTESIGQVTITGSGGPDLWVFIGDGAFPTGGTNMTSAAANLGGISVTDSGLRGNTRFAGRISGNVTGSISIGQFYRFDVGGAVSAQVRAKEPGGSWYWVRAGSVSSSGSILCDQGRIRQVDVFTDCLGDIIASNGGIGDIIIGGNLQADVSASGTNSAITSVQVTGDIGTTTSAVSISSGDRIQLVGCNRAWANIAVPSTNGALHRIETTGGPFIGSISADYIEPSLFPGAGYSGGFYINGNLDADVTFSRYVAAPWITVTGSLPAGRTLKLGSGWYQGTTFTRQMSFGSIAGQIILNANDNSPISQWTGNIHVGPSGNQVTLSPNQSQPYQAPYYQLQSSSIGGGSVGLARYHLHDEDCIPANGYSGSSPNDNIIRLRWYGPIHWDSGYPVTVKYLSGSTWINITDWFDYEPGDNPRELEIIPLDMGTDWGAVTYLITPTSNLKCVGVTGTPEVEDEDAYMATFTFN